jgi:molecular chaperone GrpE
MNEERQIDDESENGMRSNAEAFDEEETEAALQAGVASESAQSESAYKDKFLRAMADLDNVRKRAAREIDLARRRERENVLREFLGVIDNLERAIDHAGDESPQLLEGVQAIRTQMLESLKKFGAQPFDAQGEKFDPVRHDAVAGAALADKPEGTIADVVEIGYEMDDGTVLRPAKVIVVTHG